MYTYTLYHIISYIIVYIATIHPSNSTEELLIKAATDPLRVRSNVTYYGDLGAALQSCAVRRVTRYRTC